MLGTEKDLHESASSDDCISGDESSSSDSSSCFYEATPKLVILEGNIGVGKTTLAQEMARQLNYKVLLEPTVTNPYLTKFYAEPKKYALKLQVWIYRQRFRTFVAALKHILEYKQGVILDRSVFSDGVFAVVNRDEGNISEEGYQYYLDMRSQSLKGLPVPHITVHLDASPDVCLQRIIARSRECESGVPLGYLQLLDKAYKDFLRFMTEQGSSVLSFNWDKFGSTNKVVDAIRAESSAKWNSSTLSSVLRFCGCDTSISNALIVPRYLEEAEDIDESNADSESERILHQQEMERQQESDSSNSEMDSVVAEPLTA